MIGTVHAAIRDGVLPECKWWPARATSDDPAGPRTVLFVLRQWAEEDSPALARVLARQYGWARLLLGIRAGSDRRLDDDAGLATRLRHFGLPETPGTIRHLRAVAAGDPQRPLPTRGMLVMTNARSTPPHDVSITGQLEAMTKGFMAKAVAPTMIEHRAYVDRHIGEGLAALQSHGERPLGQTTWTEEEFRRRLPLAQADFEDRHGRKPHDTELATEVGVSKATFGRYKRSFSPRT
jgi:hypothetical protein